MKSLILSMDKRMHRKGFTLIEMMLVLFIITISLLSFGVSRTFLDLNSPELILSDLIHTQYNSILFKQESIYQHDKLNSPYEIVFKSNGNTVQAQTFTVYGHTYTISLGPGRVYE